MIKLNIGCGKDLRLDYVNIDCYTREEILERYPGCVMTEIIDIFNYDVFHLPYVDGTVDEVYANSFLEHLSFKEEKKFLYEVRRVLKRGGLFIFSVPDFEDAVFKWLKAKDEWKEFYRDDEVAVRKNHWFGQYSYSMDNRWGYLTACLYGTQNGKGQFHKNCYTQEKIKAMMDVLVFRIEELSFYYWKGDKDKMILVRAVKP